jgi:site-specific recombinase XerD
VDSNVLQLIDRPHEDDAFLSSFLLGRPSTTARVYKGEIRLFQDFINKPLRLACADDLRGYIEHCRQSKLRPGTLRHRVSVVKSFFSFLYDEGKLNTDPMHRVPTPPHPQPDASRCLNAKQVRTFFAVIPKHRTIGFRDRAMFILAANTGLRLSELSRLSVGDVSDGPEKGWYCLRIHGKGDKIRLVQVRPEVWTEIQQYMRRRKDELKEPAPLFLSIQRGHSIRPQRDDLRIPAASIYKRFKRYARQADLPSWAAPHSLRHFFASQAHAKGAPAEAIRRALGHTSLAVTQRYLDGLDRGVNEAFAAVKAV